jgi:hypothetical protein
MRVPNHHRVAGQCQALDQLLVKLDTYNPVIEHHPGFRRTSVSNAAKEQVALA